VLSRHRGGLGVHVAAQARAVTAEQACPGVDVDPLGLPVQTGTATARARASTTAASPAAHPWPARPVPGAFGQRSPMNRGLWAAGRVLGQVSELGGGPRAAPTSTTMHRQEAENGEGVGVGVVQGRAPRPVQLCPHDVSRSFPLPCQA
jgi:hypothetical protein